MADCQYYTGDYRTARDTYARAKAENASDADYASYRHAVMLGLDGDVNGKIKELSEIENNFPDSKWMPNVLLEKALTYEAIDRNDKAADAFSCLASRYPKSVQARKAMINLALTYSKAGKMEQAADTYKEIIRTWPSSEEASIANDDLRKYYASRESCRSMRNSSAVFLKQNSSMPMKWNSSHSTVRRQPMPVI